MFRKISRYLLEWKQSPCRKPLILQGAGQVGKTYSLLAFGREHYENVAYFNFETTPSLAKIFEESLEPSYLIPILSRLANQTIIREKTLVIFDEVQLCERALASLNYFCQQASAYHIIAAGSLLGVAAGHGKSSFPAGRVDIKTLYPMDMEEFLLARGEQGLVEQIRVCFEEDSPLPSALHEAALRRYREFLVVGGMPDCVSKFVETGDYILVRHLQRSILQNYRNDMSRHSKANEVKKARLVYDNITVQLSKKNTRFQYKLVKSGGRAGEFETAIEWLTLSGIVSRVYRVEPPWMPLESYRDTGAFKTYLSDVGLLCAKKEVVAEDILYLSGGLDDFKGGMVENYICNQLVCNGYQAYYWLSDRGAEVDFVIQRGRGIIPIEVKSADNTKAKSLGVYRKAHSPDYAIKVSARNFGFEDGVKTVPLYAAFCI